MSFVKLSVLSVSPHTHVYVCMSQSTSMSTVYYCINSITITYTSPLECTIPFSNIFRPDPHNLYLPLHNFKCIPLVLIQNNSSTVNTEFPLLSRYLYTLPFRRKGYLRCRSRFLESVIRIYKLLPFLSTTRTLSISLPSLHSLLQSLSSPFSCLLYHRPPVTSLKRKIRLTLSFGPVPKRVSSLYLIEYYTHTLSTPLPHSASSLFLYNTSRTLGLYFTTIETGPPSSLLPLSTGPISNLYLRLIPSNFHLDCTNRHFLVSLLSSYCGFKTGLVVFSISVDINWTLSDHPLRQTQNISSN